MKTRTKLIAGFIAAPFVAVAMYFSVAWLMVLFPANGAQTEQPDVEAFVISNGVHVDLVFPVKSAVIDWTTVFPTHDLPVPPARPAYIAIGWGDREFYLNTQELRDITVGRAVGALSGGHRSLIHTYYLQNLGFATRIYRLSISDTQYASLVRHVRETLVLLPDGTATHIAGRHYGAQDAFYEARGSYNLFTTCNTWVGDALLRAGVKVSRWTPLDSMVVWHLPKVSPPPCHFEKMTLDRLENGSGRAFPRCLP